MHRPLAFAVVLALATAATPRAGEPPLTPPERVARALENLESTRSEGDRDQSYIVGLDEARERRARLAAERDVAPAPARPEPARDAAKARRSFR
ncbi:MAG: hypothetical protein ACFBWO_04930 [Paracoccaceae bacterium]